MRFDKLILKFILEYGMKLAKALLQKINLRYPKGFPCGSDSKVSACNEGDLGSIPGSGRSPGEGNGNPLQHSCLENPMDRGAWWATVHGVAKSRTRLSDFTSLFSFIGYYKMSIPSCATFRPLLVIYFIYCSVYMLITNF